MNKRFILLISIAAVISCGQPSGKSGVAGEVSSNYEDYCASFTTALNGVFSTPHARGTMTWIGGLQGSVEIGGADYNDMTCTYVIEDCENGIIKMNCDGAGYDTEISLFTPDSIKLGPTTYTRVR